MPGLVISVGGRLDKSYTNALQQAAILAKQEQRKMAMIRELAPNQLSIVNRALTTLPQESLMRPKLEAMKATLTAAMGGAGAAAGQSFLARMLAALGGHEGKMGMMQLIHTGRATFDALVAGISPWRVFLYEMPQLLQSITLIGGSALKVLASIAAVGGSIAAIIAAPFLYLWRVSSIADRLSKFKLPDLDTSYIARVDNLAESYRKIANAIRDTVNQYNSATAAAERANKAMEAQFQLQSELDNIAKERAIQAALGDKNRIAAIEKQYEQLNIQREAEKLDAQKASKVAEKAALEKEIAEQQKKIAAIKFGADDKHTQTMSDLEKAFQEAKKTIAEAQNQPGFFGRIWRDLRVGAQSGGFAKGLVTANPNEVSRLSNEQLAAEAQAQKDDLERAKNIVAQYLRLKNLEQARTDAIKDREKLQSEAEKKSQRYAELTMQINDSEKEKAQILARMNTLAAAKGGQIDQNTRFGGGAGGAASVTERERIGLGAASSIQVSILDVAKQHKQISVQQLAAMQQMVKEIQEGGW